jgi:iron complex outermembrane recepter protein
MSGLAAGAAPALAAAAPSQEPAAGGGQIEEVTVVARKRAEDVQTVPIPVTVLSQQTLARENLVNFTDFQVKFPAFSVYLTNPKQLNIGVRGIGNNGFNTDGIDGSVGVFVDGVYTGRLGMVSSDFNDIDQVELLRGPQGTLFGKNTTAGAIIINSKKPSFTPELAAEVTGGDEGLQQYKISASGPLIDGKLAARLSAFYSDRRGNYPNAYDGGSINARQGEGVRLQLLGNVTDKVTVRVIAAHGSQGFNSIAPVTLSVYNPAALKARMAAAGYTLLTSDAAHRQVDIDGRQYSSTRSDLISGQADWDLGNYGALTSITAYQAWSCYTYNDNDYIQLDAIHDYGSCNRERQFSQEVRWATPKDRPVEAVTGVFVSSQELIVDSRVQFGSQYYIWASNPSSTLFPAVGGSTWAKGAYASAVTGAGFQSRAKFHTNTQAVFGNVTWHPDAARRWSLDIGLRQTWEARRMTYNGWVASNPGGLTQAQLNALSPAGANAQLGQASDSITDSALSGQAAVSYRLTPNVMAYVQVARGHKSKGFNLLPENASNPDPGVATAIAHGASQDIAGETADNVEVGVKSEWLDHRLLVNATLFDTLVSNYQANESIGVGNTATKFLANVGAMRSKGIEVEAEAWAWGGVHLKGFASYNLATYASFHNSVCPGEYTTLSCDLTGRQVAWAPKWTTDLTVDYSRQIIPQTTSYIVVDENWRSDQNTTITLDPLANIKGYALTSLRVGTLFRRDTIDAQLWVENLFDKTYYINLLGYTKSTGLVQGYPGAPRTFGGTLRVKF